LSPLPCGPGGKHGIACLQPNQGEERVIGTHPQAQGIGFMHMHFDRNLSPFKYCLGSLASEGYLNALNVLLHVSTTVKRNPKKQKQKINNYVS